MESHICFSLAPSHIVWLRNLIASHAKKAEKTVCDSIRSLGLMISSIETLNRRMIH